MPLVARACRRLHAARPFLHDFDMFQIQRSYLGVVQERGFRLPHRYLEFESQVARSRRRCACARSRPSHATTICSRRTSSTSAARCGSSTTSTPATTSRASSSANIWSESNLALASSSSSSRLLRRAAPQQDRARCALGPSSKYGWMLWASIQDGVSELEFDFWSWGMEKYERAVAEFDGPDFERLLSDVQRDD